MARVIVCGGRDFADQDVVDNFLDSIVITEVIHGGASGADTLAGRWAQRRGVPVKVYPADWNKHGRAAGPIRNQQMLDTEDPTAVIAFPGGRGTADMVRRAEDYGVPIYRVDGNQSRKNPGQEKAPEGAETQ